ncbi:MAG: hypothetical protein AB3N10_09505 [Allomuricauda sp.]
MEHSSEVRATTSEFLDLGDEKYELLIVLATEFVEEEKSLGRVGILYGPGGEGSLPEEFTEFGIKRIFLRNDEFVGVLYDAFGSGGGKAVVVKDESGTSILKFVSGEFEDNQQIIYRMAEQVAGGDATR